MSAITSDMLDTPQIIGSVGAVFYAQVNTWLVQYNVFILLIALMGLVAFGVSQVINGEPQPLWSTVKASVGVFIVMLVLYRPVVFKDVREYAPAVSPAFAAELASTFGNGSASVPAALPYPVYFFEKVMNIPRDIAIAASRDENRFILPMAENATKIGSAQAALSDTNTNAAQAIWNRVIGPAILTQYPSLASSLRSRGLEYRFLHPSSPDTALTAGKQAEQIVTLVNDANIDFPAMMPTLMPSITEYLRGSSPWSFSSGSLTAPMVTEETRNKALAPAPDAGSTQQAVAAYQRGKTVLDSFGIAARPMPEDHTSFATLYRSIGNAVEFSTAKNLGGTTNSIVAIGAACQANGDRCREHIAQGRDVTLEEARKDTEGLHIFERIQRFGAGVLLAPKALVSSAEAGVISRLIPTMIGAGKALLLFAMPILLIFSLWAGAFGILVTACFRLVVFFGIWEIAYILYLRLGEPLLSAAFNFVQVTSWFSYPIINNTILGLLGTASFMLAFMQLDKFRGAGAKTYGTVGQSANVVSPMAASNVAGRVGQAAQYGQSIGRAVGSAPNGFGLGAGLRAGLGLRPPPGVNAGTPSPTPPGGGGAPTP